MAQTMTLNQARTFTVGTTLTELTGDTSFGAWLVVTELADTLYIVTDASVSDGAAVPTNREVIGTGSLPAQVWIKPYGKVLVAQASSGTATLKVVGP